MREMSTDIWKVEGDFPVYFRYTVGVAGEKFFREIKDNGKLVGSCCKKCDITYVPPRIFCERCMSRPVDFVNVENTGTVESYTTCYRDSQGKVMEKPTTVAFVRFNGTHGGLIQKVHGDVAIGDKVRVVFKDKAQRTGSILDIAYFERL
jgi:hypothetical protein